MLGMKADKVRQMGRKRALEVAYAVAVREGVPVFVPVPGTRKATVVRPPGPPAMSLVAAGRKRAIVLPAQMRGPLPSGSPIGNRGPLPSNVVKALSDQKAQADRARSAVERASDAVAAKATSHHMSRKAIGQDLSRLASPQAAIAAKRQGAALKAQSGMRIDPVVASLLKQGHAWGAGGSPFRLGTEGDGQDWPGQG